MFFGYICYGQGNTRANAGVAYGSGINKNVENNSFRMEYWGTIGYNIVEDYEKAKVNITNKSKLKDLVLDALYKNEQEKKILDAKYSDTENSVNKIKNQLEKIQDKEEVKITENIKPEPNYQQKYIDDNLASIIAAIKKHKKYPYQAKKQGMIGKVVIQCTITSNGIIQNIKIIEASKYELLNKNSIEILEIASKEFVSPKRDVTISIPFNYFLD